MAPKRKAAAASGKAKPPEAKPPAKGASRNSYLKETPAAKPAEEVPEARPVKRRQPEPVVLQPVQHFSHGKVPARVFVFGDGDCGQLGLGEDVTERQRPAPLDVDGKQVLQVACGGMHTLALTEDHQVYSWGVNDEGALGRETEGEAWDKSGIATGNRTDSYVPVRVPLPDNAGRIVQITAGDSHSVALSELGSVWVWGTYRDASGVMGFSAQRRIQLLPLLVHAASTPEDQVLKVASGADHTLALTAGGRLLSWGSGQQGQLGRVGERVSERSRFATLLTPGVVPLRVKNRRINAGASKVVDVSCGTYSTFALTEAGAVYAWGLNNYGQLGIPGKNVAFAPTVVAALEGKRVKRVAAGQHHTLALTAAGQLLSFGRPTYGRLGRSDADVGADEGVPEPRAVEGLDGVQVAGAAAGLAVSGCFSAQGDAWLWGFGTNNQLAKGDDDTDEPLPARLAETKRFSQQKVLDLEFGGQHVALLVVPKGPAEAGQAAAQGTSAPAGDATGQAASARNKSGAAKLVAVPAEAAKQKDSEDLADGKAEPAEGEDEDAEDEAADDEEADVGDEEEDMEADGEAAADEGD